MVYLEKRNANLALGEKQMASRSFRVFGTRTDLESVFYEFQKLNLVKYYKCGRNENKIDDITKTIYFGISLNGSHIGNQYLVIKDDKSICFDKYKHISQYLNETSVAINLGGLYDENTIVPTTVSTIWYDNKISKEIFNDLIFCILFFYDMYSARTWKMGACLSQINGRIISRLFKKSGFK